MVERDINLNSTKVLRLRDTDKTRFIVEGQQVDSYSRKKIALLYSRHRIWPTNVIGHLIPVNLFGNTSEFKKIQFDEFDPPTVFG